MSYDYDYDHDIVDYSWPTQEQLLTWRIEDLQGQLETLQERLPSSCMDQFFDRRFYSKMSNEEIDYTIPAQLTTIEDVLTGIRRAKAKLWDLQCDQRTAALAMEREQNEMIPGQIVIIGFADALHAEALKRAS